VPGVPRLGPVFRSVTVTPQRLWTGTLLGLFCLTPHGVHAESTPSPVQLQQAQAPQTESEQDRLGPADRALLEAAHSANLELCIFALERGANPDIRERSNDSSTALMIASASGATGIVKKLLAKGASVNATSKTGITALMQAARSSQTEVARLLIEAGAKMDVRDNREGYTALMHAAEQGNQSILGLLLEADADVNLGDSSRGLKPLMLVAGRLTGFPMLLDLLAGGAKINSRAKDGWTALMAATSSKNNDAVEVLILNGAELLAETDDGRTAFTIAANENALPAMQLLTSAYGKKDDLSKLTETTHIAARNGFTEIVTHMLLSGINPDRYNSAGLTVLHSAVLSGNVETVTAVLQSNVNLDATTEKDGHTALMLAANRDMLLTVKRLLTAGASVDLIARDGWTATEAAKMVGAMEIVETLRSHKK